MTKGTKLHIWTIVIKADGLRKVWMRQAIRGEREQKGSKQSGAAMLDGSYHGSGYRRNGFLDG